MMNNRSEIGKKTVVYGLMGNIFLTVFKLVIGITARSTVVIADAADSFSDVVSSLVLWFGISEAAKNPDKEHPYGHGDVEPISGLIASIILCIVGFEIARFSFLKIFTAESPPETFAIYAILPTIVVKELMFRYTLKVSEVIKSPALRAGAMNYKGDIYSFFVVIGGLIGAGLGYHLLDPIAGFIVSLFVLKMGVEVGRENIQQLMGTVPSTGLQEEIKKVAEGVKGTKCIHNIRIHSVGAFATVDLHICVDEKLSIGEAHEIASIVQAKILDTFQEINYALVHIEPYDMHHKLNHG